RGGRRPRLPRRRATGRRPASGRPGRPGGLPPRRRGTPAMLPRVVLQPKRARPFFGRHPWVFAGAVAAVEGDPAEGAEVDLVTHAGQFVARGLYNGKSKIRGRLYSWQPDVPLDAAFFRERLASAVRLRDALGLTAPGGACRLVFSEGD